MELLSCASSCVSLRQRRPKSNSSTYRKMNLAIILAPRGGTWITLLFSATRRHVCLIWRPKFHTSTSTSTSTIHAPALTYNYVAAEVLLSAEIRYNLDQLEKVDDRGLHAEIHSPAQASHHRNRFPINSHRFFVNV